MSSDSHSHCHSCYSSTCSFTPCPIKPCRLNCQVSLHLCKQEDHEEEICTNKEVPCINSYHGCKDVFSRKYMAEHLSHCPASITICTHTWNRWPLSFRRYNQLQYFREGQLDYEMVLRDQRMERQLVMIPRKVKVQLRNFLTRRFPEVPVPEYTFNKRDEDDRNASDKVYTVDEEGNVIVDANMKKYIKQQTLQDKAWKRDLDTKLAENVLNRSTEATKLQREGIHNHCRSCVVADCSLGKVFDPERWRESCTMIECRWGCGVRYHNCKTEDHSFVCKLFREPDDMDWLRRLQIDDGGTQDGAGGDNIDDDHSRPNITTIFSCAGDGVVPTPPQNFKEPVYLDVNIETIHKMHVKPVAIRSFICGKLFRRNEIDNHLVNVHQQIIPGLSSGWFLSRCPLAYLGCSFACENMSPCSDRFRLKFSRADDNFCSRLEDAELINAGNKTNQLKKVKARKSNENQPVPSLAFLPVEILFVISRWLDSISLRNLSLTCKRIREICFSLVTVRGCVSPVWERQRARGQRREKKGWVVVRHRWFFSSAMSPVLSWNRINESAIQKHLENCSFNNRNVLSMPAVSKLFKEELQARVDKNRRSDWFTA